MSAQSSLLRAGVFAMGTAARGQLRLRAEKYRWPDQRELNESRQQQLRRNGLHHVIIVLSGAASAARVLGHLKCHQATSAGSNEDVTQRARNMHPERWT